MSSGYTALVGAWYLGRRVEGNLGTKANIPHVLLGTALLWFGWYGFNAGSAGAASFLAGQALLTTTIAPAAAMVTWMLIDYLVGKQVGAVGMCSGVVVGLVAITPAAGFVTTGSSMMIGIIGAACSNGMQHVFQKYVSRRLDDSLDAFPCHGMGGTVGMILTACFATTDVNPLGYDGLFYGGGKVFWHTLVVLIVIIPFICLASYICFKVGACKGSPTSASRWVHASKGSPTSASRWVRARVVPPGVSNESWRAHMWQRTTHN